MPSDDGDDGTGAVVGPIELSLVWTKLLVASTDAADGIREVAGEVRGRSGARRLAPDVGSTVAATALYLTDALCCGSRLTRMTSTPSGRPAGTGAQDQWEYVPVTGGDSPRSAAPTCCRPARRCRLARGAAA